MHELYNNGISGIPIIASQELSLQRIEYGRNDG